MSLDPMDPMNVHGQLVSPQTGLPPLNLNNPPQPPPSVSSGGPSAGPGPGTLYNGPRTKLKTFLNFCSTNSFIHAF